KTIQRFLPCGLLAAGLFAACTDDLPTGVPADALSPAVSAAEFVGADGVPFTSLEETFAGSALDLDRWQLSGAPARVTVDNRLQVALAPRTAEAIKVMYRLPQNFQGAAFQTEISQYAAGS